MSEHFIDYWRKHFLPEDEWERAAIRGKIDQEGVWFLLNTIRDGFIQIVEDYRRHGHTDLETEFIENLEWREIMVACIADQALSLLWGEQPKTTPLEKHMAEKLIAYLRKQTSEKRDSRLKELDMWVPKILWDMLLINWWSYIRPLLRIPVIAWLVAQEFEKQ